MHAPDHLSADIAFVRDQQDALELIASGASLDEILTVIVERIEAHAPGMRGSVLLLPDGVHLRHGAAPNLPQAYIEAIDGLAIGPSVGSCGTAMWHDRRVVVADIAIDPLWEPYRDAALPHGLRACWSTPLHGSSGRVLGSFAMYYGEPREPTDRDLGLADVASHLCSLAVEHAWSADLLRRRAAEQGAVAAISQRALSGGDLAELMEELVAAVADTLGTQAALFARTAGDALVLRAGRDWPADRVPAPEASVEVPGEHGSWGVLAVGCGPLREDADELVFLRSLANVLAVSAARHRADDELRHRALHDQLTGLPNRSLLMGLLEHAVERAHRSGTAIAVLLLDLDGFKAINDTLGHAAGDELLVRLAPRLQEVVRASDTIARFGGDEFVVVAEDVADERVVVRLGERLLGQVGTPIAVAGATQVLTVSIGAAVGRGADVTAAGLLRDADVAMYEAKRHGGSALRLFDAGMRERVRRRLALAGGLRDAVDRDGLALRFQPVVTLQDRAPVGAEALLRWPGEPDVTPAAFVPLAEDSGLTGALGAWSLDRACATAVAWTGAAADHWVAVNVSARQLASGGLEGLVAGALERHGLAPGRLVLEIAEPVLAEEVGESRRTLRALVDLGVRLAIDEVGHGVPLPQLVRHRVDLVKLDRSYVAALPHDGRAAATIAGVVAMAGELGVEVVATGIETEEQLVAVRDRGCRLGQGFLLGPPA